MDEKILSVKNLSVEYISYGRGACHAVNDVSFEVFRGEVLGLVGETGAGKTTIALSIMRLLPIPQGRVIGGAVLLDNLDIFKLSDEDMRRIRGEKISMIFQDPMTALNPIDRVGDQIAEMIYIHQKTNRIEAEKRAVAMLEKVGIPGQRYSDYPHQFSGGMRQRVVIAIALVCSPLLLIADEPTTALDVTIQAQVLDMMNKLKTELGTSVILISHDLGVIAEMCDRVAVIYAGEVVELGSAPDVFESPLHPYTQGLFGSLPDIETRNRRLTPIDGQMPDPANLPKGCKFSPRCTCCKESCREAPVDLTEISREHYVRCFLVNSRKVGATDV